VYLWLSYQKQHQNFTTSLKYFDESISIFQKLFSLYSNEVLTHYVHWLSSFADILKVFSVKSDEMVKLLRVAVEPKI